MHNGNIFCSAGNLPANATRAKPETKKENTLCCIGSTVFPTLTPEN